MLLTVCMTLVTLLQADGVDLPVINGHSVVSVTDASAARGGDDVARTQSRQAAHTSAAASSTCGNLQLT